MKYSTDFGKTFNNAKSYEFSLFPMIAFNREEWASHSEYSFIIGLWFWYWEINVYKDVS